MVADTAMALHMETSRHAAPAPAPRIVRQYQVRSTGSGGDRWLWVQWAPDTEAAEGGCLFRFTLFRIAAPPAPVATTNDGCDR
jgi:hypothetical protein